jgi:hypothetical protein
MILVVTFWFPIQGAAVQLCLKLAAGRLGAVSWL